MSYLFSLERGTDWSVGLHQLAQWRQQLFRPNKPLPKDVTGKTAKAPALCVQDYNTFELEATAEYTDPEFPVPLTELLQEILQSLTATLSEVCTSSVFSTLQLITPVS